MKKLIIPLAIVITFLTVLLFGYLWWGRNSQAVSSVEVKIRFVIPKGWSATQIGNSLFEKDIIKNPLAFKIFVQLTGKTKSLKPGEFTLSPSMNLVEIVDKLMQGPDELWVTIPEGLRREEIVEEFIADLEMDEFQAAEFRGDFLASSKGREGFLFPDTYLFPRDIEASLVVRKMLDTFDVRVDASILQSIEESEYNLNQVITMASIIERESRFDEERPVVSGILWKRLETEGWLLQADATVQYAVGSARCQRSSIECVNWWPILTKEDLDIDSQYNSYLFKSLPPFPIANPGIGSIKAAVFPEESSYWFYIHDPEGKIHYARTISEHNANVKKYLGK